MNTRNTLFALPFALLLGACAVTPPRVAADAESLRLPQDDRRNPPSRTTTTTTTTYASTTRTDDRDKKFRPVEVIVAGAGVSNEKLEAGAAAVNASVGFYANEVIAFVVRQNMSYGRASEDSSEVWDGISRAGLDFHIPLGCFVPYVGGTVGYVYGDTYNESMCAGPEGGVKLYLKDDAFLTLGIEYQFFFDEGDSLETAFDEGQFIYSLGMGLRF